MAEYSRPSFETLVSRIRGDFASRTEGSPYIKRSIERVLSYVVAAVANGVHGHFDWLRKQLLPTTCGIDGLLAWGVLLDTPRNGATAGTGTVTFTGTNTTVLPVDTALQDAEGNAFTVTVGGTVSAGSVTVTVEADDGGDAGNLETGAVLSLVSPIAGIDTDGEVATDFTGGADLEETEDYRERILNAVRVPPSGGGPGDYETWAKAATDDNGDSLGVTRAWEFGNRMGYGTVSLGFVIDGRVDPIPTVGDVADVQAYIEALMPLDMRELYVVAPIAAPVDITIALRPNNSTVRAAVTAALEDFFASEDVDLETVLEQSNIDEVISTADGETAHEITAITSLDPGDWGLLTLGDLTFTTL